jgi:plastocyanin
LTTGSVPPAPTKSGSTKWIAIGVVVVVIVAGLAYFFLYNAGPAIKSVTVVMPNGVGTIQNLNFQPPAITVVIGVNNTVVWTNQDTTSHTVLNATAPIGFGSGTSLITNGQSFSFTFTTPGTYNYFCNIHPTWMKGTVTVKAHG